MKNSNFIRDIALVVQDCPECVLECTCTICESAELGHLHLMKYAELLDSVADWIDKGCEGDQQLIDTYNKVVGKI